MCAGVAYGFDLPSTGLVVVVVCAGGALTALRRRPHAAALGIACLAFAFGALDARARIGRAEVLEEAARGAPRCRFLLRALESEGGLGTLLGVDGLSCRDEAVEGTGALVWLDRAVVPGAALSGEGYLVPLGDDGFEIARRRFGAGAELVIVQSQTLPPESGLAGLAHDIRAGLANATHGMAPDRAALLAGVTTGDTSAFDDAMTNDFRAAGLSHLVAVSGQNVAMVVAAVAAVTYALAARTRVFIALAAVGLFVLVVGPQPSVLRAAAMAMIALTGLGFGFRGEPWHLFALALIVVIALRPAVMYSAGLHLSAAATAGLLLWARTLAARFTRLPRWVALTLAATLAAQFAVMPLIVGLFGTASATAPIANVLALPAVPAATVLGLCAAVVGTVSAGGGGAIALLAEPFVAWILWVARTFGRIGWAAVDVPEWVAWPLGAVVVGAAVATAGKGRAATLGSLE